MIKLVGYKADKGLFFCNGKRDYNNKPYGLNKDKIRVNGKGVTDTHHPSWYFLEGESDITSFEEWSYGGYGEVYFKLIDEDLFIEGRVPLIIDKGDADPFEDHNDIARIGESSPYYKISGLYESCRDRIEDSFEEVEFEFKLLGEVKFDEVFLDKSLIPSYTVNKGATGNSLTASLISVATYEELNEMLVPSVAIHNTPCKVDSVTTYRIIRNWVIENIDPKVAKITSNYDFCFTIKKLIKVKAFTSSREITKANGRSYRKPRYNTKLVTDREVEIFEMTHDQSNYKGYTAIKGFKGDSLIDLAENIKLYLDELVSYINEPVEDCSHCGGTGCIIKGGGNEIHS